MQSNLSLGEVRPSTSETPSDAPASGASTSDFTPPLLRLRSSHRQPVTPETCLVRSCPICEWRRDGLLDTPVVRETPRYDTASPRCAYMLGREHGRADGPQSRPTRDWLDEAGLEATVYLRGYDEGCQARTTLTRDTPLWDAADACLDGMSF